MLELINVSKYFGDRTVLKSVCFKIDNGQKVGLVGQNGSGKSTLLKIIAGQIEPDHGGVHLSGNVSTAYLAQSDNDQMEGSVAEFLAPDSYRAWQAMATLEESMARGEESSDLLRQYTAAAEAC